MTTTTTMEPVYIRAAGDTTRHERERGLRVRGLPAEYGHPGVVTVNVMIDGPSVSVGQRNLTADAAREMARALDAAAAIADTSR